MNLLFRIRDGLPSAHTFNIPDLKNLFPNYTFPGFLPEDFLDDIIPDFNLPGVDINICPGLESDVYDVKSAVQPSASDSQRSFTTTIEQHSPADSDGLLGVFFGESVTPVNNVPEPENILQSFDNSTQFNIEKGDDEQRYRDYQQEASVEAEAIHTSLVWNYTKTSLFNMFGVLDGILIVYRVVKIYIVIAQLIRGFPETIPQEATEKKIAANKKLAIEFDAKCRDINEKTGSKKQIDKVNDDGLESDAEREEKEPDKKRGSGVGDRALCVAFGCFHILSMIYLGFIRGIKMILISAFRTTLVPKLLVVACACIASYFVIVAAFLYLTIQSMEEIGFYDMLSARLDLNLEYTNLKILENLNFLQNSTLTEYVKEMKQELSGIADIINAFNIEQVDNYM